MKLFYGQTIFLVDEVEVFIYWGPQCLAEVIFQ